MTRLISIAAALALILSAGIAQAQTSGSETRSVAVGYLDLDLSSPAGRATLTKRIDTAVKTICGKRPAPREMVRGKLYSDCVAGARENSRQQMARLFGNQPVAENAIRVTAPNK
jgi:UrcA family protein